MNHTNLTERLWWAEEEENASYYASVDSDSMNVTYDRHTFSWRFDVFVQTGQWPMLDTQMLATGFALSKEDAKWRCVKAYRAWMVAKETIRWQEELQFAKENPEWLTKNWWAK